MPSNAKKRVLPRFSLTEVCDSPSDGVPPILLPREGQPPLTYFPVPKVDPKTAVWTKNKPKWVMGTYRLFPLVLCGDGAPWAEANIWVIEMLQSKVMPNMLTFDCIAGDLAAYRRYIEEEGLDWLEFESHKLRRPTYRYNGALTIAARSGEVAPSVAKRRMGTVIRFYRWLINEGLLKPANPPWVKADRYVDWKNKEGVSRVMVVETTDVSIKTSKVDDIWDDRIQDGGRLRPLPKKEQMALLKVLQERGNTEMSLIHLFALLSGARIQTVLTVRVRHVSRNPDEIVGNDCRITAGPGTGIDTKGETIGVLHLPKGFYEQLHIYSKSERARKRRLKAEGGDHEDQLLFLSHRGAALYETREQLHHAKLDGHAAGHAKLGGGVRQFIKEKIIPGMRVRLNNPQYSFRFHDLRATFGMNFVDSQAPLLKTGKVKYHTVLYNLSQLMWHSSMTITEGYLQYRGKLLMIDAAERGWHAHLVNLAKNVSQKG